MQVKAVYDHGKVDFLEDVKLKHNRFNVVVDVPEEEVDTIARKCKSINEELDAILGEYRKGNSARSSKEDKAVWHAHLENKYT